MKTNVTFGLGMSFTARVTEIPSTSSCYLTTVPALGEGTHHGGRLQVYRELRLHALFVRLYAERRLQQHPRGGLLDAHATPPDYHADSFTETFICKY